MRNLSHSILAVLLLFCLALQPNCLQAQKREMGPYSIEWDTATFHNYLYNSVTKKRKQLRVRYPRAPGRFFANNFVLVSSSDMRCLFDLNGNEILDQSHYIHYDMRKDIIKAWVCADGIWIFLDQDGDTLSYGRSGHRYSPSLDKPINFALSWNEYRKARWGILAPDANWIFPPILKDTLSFINEKATVEINGYSVTFYERFLKKGYYADLDTSASNLQALSPHFLKVYKLEKMIPLKVTTRHKEPRDSALWGAERPPQFPGGKEALIEFLRTNYNYGLVDSLEMSQGIIFIRFTVKKDGQLKDFKVLKGVHPILNKELIRVMKKSPRWLPAICYDIDQGEDTPPNQYCQSPFTIPFRINSQSK